MRAGHVVHDLTAGWELATLPPGSASTCAELQAAAPSFRAAIVPGTVAMVTPAEQHAAIDASDHVYRVRFATPAHDPEQGAADRMLLELDGLATISEVWLNGSALCSSRSMFIAVGCDVTDRLRAAGEQNELVIFFRALLPVLRAKQPRGRWPVPMVAEKHVRFVRTTLLGYTPGYCPSIRPVGPYAGVRLIEQRGVAIERVQVQASFEAGSTSGSLHVELEALVLGARTQLQSATLVLEGHGQSVRTALTSSTEAERVSVLGDAVLRDAKPWWPHTHGTPALYDAAIELTFAQRTQRIELGKIGFRSIARSSEAPGDFGLVVNGQPIFCRGASWTPIDLRALHASPSEYDRALRLVRDAGMNMLRVAGTMTYESDAFYARCDELGILVWQDFMFANFDYPVQEPAFASQCREEARQLLQRLSGRPSLAVLCGGSEAEQQPAMMGLPLEVARQPLFHTLLAELCAQAQPGVPYVTNSPSEGSLPFSVNEGPAHYYGVGAYMRRLEDARASRLRFASECLAFSNVPEPETLHAWLGVPVPAVDDRYRAGVVRDLGASWTFGDVTEHYMTELFGGDPKQLALEAPARYFAQSRAASAEMIGRALGIWRAREFGCRGALVWFLRDLGLGAGWGVIDARGVPKAAYYAIKRTCAPIAAYLVDHALDGIVLHVFNDTSELVRGRLEVELYRADGALVVEGNTELTLGPHSEHRARVDALVGQFVDSSYAFRFGPPAHALVAGRFVFTREGQQEQRSDCIAPLGLSGALSVASDSGLTANVRSIGPSRESRAWELTLFAQRFAPFIAIDAAGYDLSDNYFHLAPRTSQRVVLTARDADAAPVITVQPLGAAELLRISLGLKAR